MNVYGNFGGKEKILQPHIYPKAGSPSIIIKLGNIYDKFFSAPTNGLDFVDELLSPSNSDEFDDEKDMMLIKNYAETNDLFGLSINAKTDVMIKFPPLKLYRKRYSSGNETRV